VSGVHAILLGSSPMDATITISDEFISDVSGGFTQARAGYRLGSDGTAYEVLFLATNSLGAWCDPAYLSGVYEAQATLVWGDTPTGTLGSWVSLGSTQTWVFLVAPGSAKSCVLTVEIRKTGTATVLDTATITLLADAT